MIEHPAEIDLEYDLAKNDYSDIGLLKAYKMSLAGPRQVRADTEGDALMRRNNAMAGTSRLETRGPPGLEGSMWRQ